MKLKGLGSRAYNIMHHAHTVTGMMISIMLFVIFYAGAYSLFRAEIYQWENQQSRFELPEEISYDRAAKKVANTYNLHADEELHLFTAHDDHPYIEIHGTVEKADGSTEHMHAHMDPRTYELQDETEHQTVVSQLLFRLHYLDQIPAVGLYISGFVALFFLLATITGLLIHWRNIFQKFYAFFVGKRWKQIWTDAHTVLGVISLPFQVMYAISGALFGLSLFLLLPSVMVMFGGDQTPVLSIIRPELGMELKHEADRAKVIPIEDLKRSVAEEYPNHAVNEISLRNYGRENAVATFYIDDETGLMGDGSISMEMASGEVLQEMSRIPYQKSYGESVYALLVKLHYATYGGFILKLAYFLLALLTCGMILSGIMIWQVARDKKKYSHKQKRFHHRITKLSLSICLGLFPAIALLFLANKIIPMDYQGRAQLVKLIFFIGWLILTAIGWYWDRYAHINKNYLICGGILSLFVPLVNGMVTGDWIWETWGRFPAVAGIDIFWLTTGCLALVIAFKGLKSNTDSVQSG